MARKKLETIEKSMWYEVGINSTLYSTNPDLAVVVEYGANLCP